MKIGWGARIAALYIGFVVMIITLVGATFGRKPLLVTEDYYYRETRFQEQLDARKAAAALGPVRVRSAGDSLEILLPGTATDQAVSGTLHFYFPADPSADRSVALRAVRGRCRVSLPPQHSAHCLLQLDWAVAGRHYYTEVPAPWMH